MTMGWIDCLQRGTRMGRGVLIAGRWATPDEAPSQPPPHEQAGSTLPFNHAELGGQSG